MLIRNTDGPHKSAARNYKLDSDAASGQGPEDMFSQDFSDAALIDDPGWLCKAWPARLPLP